MRKDFMKFSLLLSCLIALNFSSLNAFIDAKQPVFGTTSSDHLITAWSAYDNGAYLIRAKNWDSTHGWSDNINLSDPKFHSFSPKIAVNSAGNGALVWLTIGANGIPTLQGTIFNNGAWDLSAVQLSPLNEEISEFDLKLDESNIITVVWQGSSNIYCLRGNTATGWDTPLKIND